MFLLTLVCVGNNGLKHSEEINSQQESKDGKENVFVLNIFPGLSPPGIESFQSQPRTLGREVGMLASSEP